jgi:type III pantothenate kinase
MNLLTVDVGNSRVKLRGWSRGSKAPIAAGEFASDLGVGEPIAAWLGSAPAFEAAALCSVAGADLEEEIARAIRGRMPAARLDLAPDPRLSIDCRDPGRVGRDRLFAARAALDLVRGDAIVVGAGTALTVDAVRSDATFLGGAIAPGPSLLARALAEGTARLPRVEPRPNPDALGRDTESALRSGVVHGFRGAAKELVERVSVESGLERTAAIVLTGGARAFLLDPPAFAGRALRVEPDLVHLGLLAALGALLAALGGIRSALEPETAPWTSSSRS